MCGTGGMTGAVLVNCTAWLTCQPVICTWRETGVGTWVGVAVGHGGEVAVGWSMGPGYCKVRTSLGQWAPSRLLNVRAHQFASGPRSSRPRLGMVPFTQPCIRLVTFQLL